MLTLTLLAFSFSTILYYFLWFLMLASMLLLIAVILLQEGKGGGLAEAFGGAGAETFGVKAHGINKFTAIVGGVFLLLCVVLNKFHLQSEAESLIPGYQPPAEQGGQDPNDLQRMIQQLQEQQGGAPAGGSPSGGSQTPPPPPPSDGN